MTYTHGHARARRRKVRFHEQGYRLLCLGGPNKGPRIKVFLTGSTPVTVLVGAVLLVIAGRG